MRRSRSARCWRGTCRSGMLVDLDLCTVGKQRRDHDLGERVAPMRRVERREPDEAADAALRLEQPCRRSSSHRHRRGLEARLLARARLDDLGLETPGGCPAEVHAEQHLRPVLGVGAAGAGRDRHHGIAGVVLATNSASSCSREPPPARARPARRPRPRARVRARAALQPRPPLGAATRSARASAWRARARSRRSPRGPGRPRTPVCPSSPRARRGGASARPGQVVTDPGELGPELRELVGDGSVVGDCHGGDRSGFHRWPESAPERAAHAQQSRRTRRQSDDRSSAERSPYASPKRSSTSSHQAAALVTSLLRALSEERSV